MASRYEQWANRPVTRDHLGRFAESAAAHARRLLADAAVPGRSVSRMYREGARPEGFEHLAGRGSFLGRIPAELKEGGLGRARTEEEHAEYDLITAAILKYNESIGLGPESQYSTYARKFPDAHEVYDPYGNVMRTADPNAPKPAQRGWRRVGDNPDGGGIWVKPGDNPYKGFIYDDRGSAISRNGTPFARRPSLAWKEDRIDRRVAVFARDAWGDQAQVETRRASTGKVKFGAIGSRGSRETDFRVGMRYMDPKLDKRLRSDKGKKKRQRTWIEKLGIRMERGEV